MKIKKGCNAQKRTMQPNMENVKSDANVPTSKDICKVFHFFRYNVGTSLDCSLATGVMRCSITWYIAYLEQEDMLMAIYCKPDQTTGHRAKYYTANKNLWRKPLINELSIWGDEV